MDQLADFKPDHLPLLLGGLTLFVIVSGGNGGPFLWLLTLLGLVWWWWQNGGTGVRPVRYMSNGRLGRRANGIDAMSEDQGRTSGRAPAAPKLDGMRVPDDQKRSALRSDQGAPAQEQRAVPAPQYRKFGSGRLGSNAESKEEPTNDKQEIAKGSASKMKNGKQKQQQIVTQAEEEELNVAAAEQDIQRAVQKLSMDGARFGKVHRLLVKYLENVLSNPDKLKYRRIRVGNERFAMVWQVAPCQSLLRAVGFREVVDVGSSAPSSTNVLLDPLTDSRRVLLRKALGQLKSMKDYVFWVE